MQHWLVKEYAKLVGNHLQIWSGSFTGRGGGSWPSEATASGFAKKTGHKSAKPFTRFCSVTPLLYTSPNS